MTLRVYLTSVESVEVDQECLESLNDKTHVISPSRFLRPLFGSQSAVFAVDLLGKNCNRDIGIWHSGRLISCIGSAAA